MARRDDNIDAYVGFSEMFVSGVMGSRVGVAAIMYGLYWTIGFFGPMIIDDGLGLLAYIVVPLAIIISVLLLLGAVTLALSFEDPVTLSAWSMAISYFTIPFIREMGWIGYSDAGKYIAYVLVFIFSWAFFLYLWESHGQILKAAKPVVGLIIFGVLLMPFLQTSAKLIRAAGWL